MGMRYFGLVLAFSITSASPSLADTLSAPSAWKNQRTSELDINSVDAKGAIVGKFTNNANGFDCKGVTVDVGGQVQADGSIVFAAAFGAPCFSVTSWKGTVQGKSLSTTWVLVYPTSKGALITLQDTDLFTQQ